MQGTDPRSKDLLIQNARIAEESCSRERTGGIEVKEPPESVYKICMSMDFRESLRLL